MNELQVAAEFEGSHEAREALADLQQAGFDARLTPEPPAHLKPRAGRSLGLGMLLGTLIGILLTAALVLLAYFVVPYRQHLHLLPVVIGALIIGGIVGGVVGHMLGSVIALHAVSEAPTAGEATLMPVVIVRTTRRDDAQSILERHGGRLRLA